MGILFGCQADRLVQRTVAGARAVVGPDAALRCQSAYYLAVAELLDDHYPELKCEGVCLETEVAFLDSTLQCQCEPAYHAWRLASGSDDGTIKYWSSWSGCSAEQTLTGHTAMVWSVDFSHCQRPGCDRRGLLDQAVGRGGLALIHRPHQECVVRGL